MPQTIKFHLDESVNPAIAKGIRVRGINVTTTPEVGLAGARDEDQVKFAKTEGRVIFTHDDDFLHVQKWARATCHRGDNTVAHLNVGSY